MAVIGKNLLSPAKSILAFTVLAGIVFTYFIYDKGTNTPMAALSDKSFKSEANRYDDHFSESLSSRYNKAKNEPLHQDVVVREEDASASIRQDALLEKNDSSRLKLGEVQKKNGSIGIISQSVMDRFLARIKNASDICKDRSRKQNTDVDIPGKGRPFFRNRFSWCSIPKVGTTFLLSLEKAMRKEETTLKRYRPAKRKSFFIVREPYSRMMSGYIGKIVTNQPWWEMFGRFIVAKTRANATRKERNCGSDVSFPEFVKYFIHSQTYGVKKNPHFFPMHEICNPCQASFDYILHLETLKEDLSYILKSANITSTNMDFSDEEMTMSGKARSIVSQKQRIIKCESMCTAMRKVWWSFHARGLVSTDIPFPLKENQCDSISEDEFSNLSLEARRKSIGKIDKRKQKRQALVDLFLQVPLEDRLKVRDLLSLDFQLFGYDSQPADIFPELVDT